MSARASAEGWYPLEKSGRSPKTAPKIPMIIRKSTAARRARAVRAAGAMRRWRTTVAAAASGTAISASDGAHEPAPADPGELELDGVAAGAVVDESPDVAALVGGVVGLDEHDVRATTALGRGHARWRS